MFYKEDGIANPDEPVNTQKPYSDDSSPGFEKATHERVAKSDSETTDTRNS
jgi:hypothetical protein